jgi:hypothetical protein
MQGEGIALGRFLQGKIVHKNRRLSYFCYYIIPFAPMQEMV